MHFQTLCNSKLVIIAIIGAAIYCEWDLTLELCVPPWTQQIPKASSCATGRTERSSVLYRYMSQCQPVTGQSCLACLLRCKCKHRVVSSVQHIFNELPGHKTQICQRTGAEQGGHFGTFHAFQGHYECKGMVLRESKTESAHEIMKGCSQTEKLCSWLKTEISPHRILPQHWLLNDCTVIICTSQVVSQFCL